MRDPGAGKLMLQVAELLKAGRPEEARQILLKLKKRDPRNPRVLSILAKVEKIIEEERPSAGRPQPRPPRRAPRPRPPRPRRRRDDEVPGNHSVVIRSFDPEWKIRAIGALREITGLGLADAKDLIESAPSTLITGLGKAEAENLKKRLRQWGMEAEVTDS